MTTPGQQRLIERLAEAIPDLADMLRGHVAHHGQLLSHVYFGDLTRYFLSIANSQTPQQRNTADLVLVALEGALVEGDESTRELILASFVENLSGEAAPHVLQRLPPKLAAAYQRSQLGG